MLLAKNVKISYDEINQKYFSQPSIVKIPFIPLQNCLHLACDGDIYSSTSVSDTTIGKWL